MPMYCVQANVSKKRDDGYAMNRQLPTFYLDSNVQGIVSAEHACSIARSIIDPWAEFTVNVHAMNCDTDGDEHAQEFGG